MLHLGLRYQHGKKGGRIIFRFIRLLFAIAVVVGTALLIKKRHGRKRGIIIAIRILIFAVGSVLTWKLPPENLFKQFLSPQEVFDYSRQGEIVKVIEGEKSALVLYVDKGKKVNALYLNTKFNCFCDINCI